jgi:uncharacterized BrkB/YihY/UPF0761 family membrane protein
MKNYSIYITLVFIVKIIFIILAITRLYIKYKKPNEKDLFKKVDLWKSLAEFIFVLMMSFLLIYLFNPRNDRIHMIDNETKILLYLYGFVILILGIEKGSSFVKD